MFFHARFECNLLRGVSMLMQYLPTTATACCFSTLFIHSRIDAFTFKILSVLCVIFDFRRWRQITLFLYRPWYFILLSHCYWSSLLTYNKHILLTFPDCTPYYVRILHLSRTYSYCWCFFPSSSSSSSSSYSCSATLKTSLLSENIAHKERTHLECFVLLWRYTVGC